MSSFSCVISDSNKFFINYTSTISSLWTTSDLVIYPNKSLIFFECWPCILIISFEEKELSPLAYSDKFLSRILIWSPFLKTPSTFLIPAANKLFPFLRAFIAPSSIIKSPLGETELIIHFFLASNFEILGKNQVQLFFFQNFFYWSF